MPQVTDIIEAKPRDGRGKGSAHKLRKAGALPAVVYGPGTQPRLLTLDPKQFTLQREQYGVSHIFEVAAEGSRFKALIREVQADPTTRELQHVDLYALDMSKPLRIEVPLELEGKPAGLLEGGILSQIMRRIEVECLPSAIPQKVTVDVSALGIGQSVKAGEVKLPAGVRITVKTDQAVATVVAPQEEEEAPAPTEAAAVEGAAPAEGAPAVEGAAPAAAGTAAAAPAAAGDKTKGGGKTEGKEGKK